MILGISTRSLWTMTNMTQLPLIRVGRRILYPLRELEAWVQREMRTNVGRERSGGSSG